MTLKLIVTLLYFIFGSFVEGRQSLWGVRITEQDHSNFRILPNYLYAGSHISFSIYCNAQDPETKVGVQWILQEVHCMEQMFQPQADQMMAIIKADSNHMVDETWTNISTTPAKRWSGDVVSYQISLNQEFKCGENHIITLRNEFEEPYKKAHFEKLTHKIIRQEDVPRKTSKESKKQQRHMVTQTWQDGMFHFAFSINGLSTSGKNGRKSVKNARFTATAIVEMKGPHGYLPAIDYPKLPYNGVMGFLYLMVSTVWIIIWVKGHLNHTLKIHIVIGLVSVAGAMSHTLVFVDHATTNTQGASMAGIYWVSIVIGMVQISLFNSMLMVVSIGYGMTRPTLGRTILGAIATLAVCSFIAGMAWFIVVDEDLKIQYNYPGVAMVVTVLYAVIYVISAGWVMLGAIFTFLHLWLRKHSNKKVLAYSVYMGTCTVAFIGLLILVGFFIAVRLKTCRTNWKSEWLYVAFWNMEALVLLLVLMWLWRPADRAQSYAFSPIVELGDDEVEDEGDDENEKISLEPF